MFCERKAFFCDEKASFLRIRIPLPQKTFALNRRNSGFSQQTQTLTLSLFT
jgi:hypothetical protein